MTRERIAAAAFAFVLLAGAVYGQLDPVPATINYQGALREADGVTPETGLKNIEFRLYAGKDDTDAVWGELHQNVELVDGAFNVELGAGEAIPGGPPHMALATVFGPQALWLGVAVQGAEERTERQQIVSAPYAFSADTAMTAVNGVPPGTIAAWAGAAPPAGWLACDGASYSRTGQYAALYAAIGNAWGEGEDPGNTFSVPNLGGRTFVGEMAEGQGQNENSANMTPAEAGLTAHTLGDLLGEETHSLTEQEMASHTHAYDDYHFSGNDTTGNTGSHVMDYYLESLARTTASTGGVDTNGDTVPDTAGEHNNMQPSIVITFIIKY